MGFWILYQNVCFLNFRYLLLFCFFRLQKSLKILILVWVLLFLILTKSLGLNKYRIESCIDTYFRFFCQNTVEREIRCRNTRRTEKENNREREIEIRSVSISLKIRIHIKAYFLPKSTSFQNCYRLVFLFAFQFIH